MRGLDLLIDVEVAVDVCAGRRPHAVSSAAALLHCNDHGGRLWLYSGSAETLEYTLAAELRRCADEHTASTLSDGASLHRARELLDTFAADKLWLAALAGEGPVFNSNDPEADRALRALERFPPGEICLLTRDKQLLHAYPEKTVTPEAYCRLDLDQSPIGFVDLNRQQDVIRDRVEHRIHVVLRHNQYVMGSEIDELEHRLAEFCGVRHAITCSSGTDALLMALLTYGIGPGDAVFVPAFTFVSTAEVVALVGATPVFVDVDEQTQLIRVGQVQAAIDFARDQGLQPRGIIPVDLFGQPADYSRINVLAREAGLYVIADAAQSFGAQLHGEPVGSLAPVTATSFFPSKPLGGYGDGGAVFTDDDALAEGLRSVRVHGKGGDNYENVRIGINGRLDTLQAAVLIEKLKVFPEEIERRNEVAQRYGAELYAVCEIPVIAEGATSVWAQYTVRVEERARVIANLKEAGVPTAVYYPTPLNRQAGYATYPCAPGGCPTSEALASRVMSLPMHPYLTADEQVTVVRSLTEKGCTNAP